MLKSKHKRHVLFVGSFKDKANDGAVGGQMQASKSLLNSSLKNEFQWLLLDTTGKSVPPPPVYIRMFFAFARVMKFIFICVFKRPNSVLIFSGNKPSIYEKGIMAIWASFLGIRVVLAPRGGPIVEEIKNSKFLYKFVRYVINCSDYIVCQGSFWKYFFYTQFPDNSEEKFVVIPNWIDGDKYKPELSINKNDDDIKVLFCGWLHKDKGVFDILASIEQLPTLKQKIRCIFLGDGLHKNDVIKKARDLSDRFSFEFPGWVYDEEKISYIQHSDIFLLPSYSEGMPNSLLEAMMCGVASIASNVGAIPDLITNNETGLLINAGDTEALTKSLTELINNPSLRKKLAKSGRAHIMEYHSIYSAVESFKKIL
jgi:glycosyltransferase involved in cell wall biosynthesis